MTMRIHHVDDIDAPELHHFRTLRRPEEHRREGLFVAEGEKVVLRLFESGRAVVSVLLTPEWLEVHGTFFEKQEKNLDAFVAPKGLLEKIVGFNLHQGIMALGMIPAPESLDEVLKRTPSPRIFAALDGLANAENVGVVVRNCAAFGVAAVIAGETSSSPYLRRAVRNSMGTVFRLPVVHADHLPTFLGNLHNRYGVRIIAADASRGSVPLETISFGGDVCVVFGSEGEGIREEVLAMCQVRVVIPMQAGVDSLNVASASAVVLYHFRQNVA